MNAPSRLQKALLGWFAENKREMPWRKTRDPYKIWVSEIMLQQTQVVTVIPYYDRWVKRFPDVVSLAGAPPEDVLKHWEGLGYYRRARNLQAAAQKIVTEFQGKFPTNYEDVLKLPGIGRYTAGAVTSIAFGAPNPVVDGNVARVYSRLFTLKEAVDLPEGEKKLWKIAEENLSAEDPGDFNQALMELGATVCLPVNPLCLACPVSTLCRAFETNRAADFPVKARKTETKKVRAVCGIVRKNGKILVVKRPESGRWAGMWEFPTFKVENGKSAKEILTENLKALGFPSQIKEKLSNAKRAYTVHQETMEIFECESRSLGKVKDGQAEWAAKEDLKKRVFPSFYVKLMETSL